MDNPIKGLRTIPLLRGSTSKQTAIINNELDIPMQRRAINDFVTENELVVIREFVEGGVSGYKISPDDRDALVAIKKLANSKKFDLLLVYHSDRIGRISDESPAVIRYLNENGVRVWSIVEGEIKSQTHSDKLMTYIRFWQSEGESVKISNRSTDSHIEAIQHGRYRGSEPPYGYTVIKNGDVNPKGRSIGLLAIDEEEAEVVKLIYNLSIKYNYGIRRIAKYLNTNGYKSRNNKNWNISTISYILNNITYKGYLHMYSDRDDKLYVSPVKKQLVIIPEDIWDLNQKKIKARQYKRNGTRKGTTHGNMLLSGLVYCGHCGSRLGVWALHKHYFNAHGEKIKKVYPTYKCYNKAINNKCEGQTVYYASKIDTAVEKYVKEFIADVASKKLAKNFYYKLDGDIKTIEKNISKKEKESKKTQEELVALKKEVRKAVIGESSFTPELLNESITDTENEIKNLLLELENLDNKLQQAKQVKREYVNLDDNLSTWIKRYEKASLDLKKSLLNEVIERIDVSRDALNITFKISMYTFIENGINNQEAQLDEDSKEDSGVEIVPNAGANNSISTPNKYGVEIDQCSWTSNALSTPYLFYIKKEYKFGTANSALQ